MAGNIKKLIVRNLIAALAAKAGAANLTTAQAETELRRLGLQPGTAHRMLDDTTNVGIETVADTATRLQLPIASLFDGHVPAMGPQEVVASLAAALSRLDPDRLRKVKGVFALLADHPDDADLIELLARWLRAEDRAERKQDRQAA